MKIPSASRWLPLLAGLVLLPVTSVFAGGDSVEETAPPPPPRRVPAPRTYYYEEAPPPVVYYYEPAPVVVYDVLPRPYFYGYRACYRGFRGSPRFAAFAPRFFYRGGRGWHR